MKILMMLVLPALAGGAAFARGEAGSDPARRDAAAPPVSYRSAFEDYRPYREQALAPWRAVNDEVGRVGGHIGVLKADAETKDDDKAAADEPARVHHHGGRR